MGGPNSYPDAQICQQLNAEETRSLEPKYLTEVWHKRDSLPFPLNQTKKRLHGRDARLFSAEMEKRALLENVVCQKSGMRVLKAEILRLMAIN